MYISNCIVHETTNKQINNCQSTKTKIYTINNKRRMHYHYQLITLTHCFVFIDSLFDIPSKINKIKRKQKEKMISHKKTSE